MFLSTGEDLMSKHTGASAPFKTKTMKANYRIQNTNGTMLNAGTDEGSWFTLETARILVDYDNGQRIVESDGVNILWEAF